MALRALILDFNSYFASVEQQARPELRGKPVAVAPMLSDYTCCIAASIQAKAFGVKTGVKVSNAKAMCPSLTVLEARPPLYIKYHQELIKAVDSCIPVTEVLSIDEVRCDLKGHWREREKALAIARNIKAKIRQDVGEYLTSSIGIAPNGFLAKTASDMQKPDGLVVIEESDLPHILYKLELRDFCGIGPRMEARLKTAGIHTVEQLCQSPRDRLRLAWGSIEGQRMYSCLRGEDIDRPESNKTTIGHSHVLDPEHRNLTMAQAILYALLQKAAARLRASGYWTTGLHVIVEFKDGNPWKGHISVQETSTTLNLIRAFNQIWKPTEMFGRSPNFVGISFSPLILPQNTTQSFFYDPKQERLSHAMDLLNTTYGKNTVYFAGAQLALDQTPLRIAFTHVPGLETERTISSGKT